jgi:acyl-CoA dehydrogenase
MKLEYRRWLISTQFGGDGLDFATYSHRLRQLAQTDAGLAVSVSVHHSVCVKPIMDEGTPEQQHTWLPQLTTGVGAFALTEACSGSDATAARLTATPTPEGGYVLNGEKLFITNAPTATVFVLFAQLNQRLTGFLVPGNTPGLTVTLGEAKLGLTTSPWGGLHLHHCILPCHALLGQPGKGFDLARRTLVGGRIGIAAIALGLADRCYHFMHTQAKGLNNPIYTQQLAHWATQQAAAEQLVQQAVYAYAHTAEATVPASMAKAFASRVCFAWAQALLDWHPHLPPNHPVVVGWADAKALEIVEGTNEIQHLVIAKQLLN